MSQSEAIEQILDLVDRIPPGRVMTYGAITEHVDGTTARSVGHALKADGHGVAWWRVVNAAGRPAPGAEQSARSQFDDEGTPLIVRDDGSYMVDMREAAWEPS
jgi:methylated-DNA-protein-cysteine methyltransferase-like protein